ncbi:MAG: Stk1 family PASTA domain-containing Ser/Thr kinase [Clostridiales bacterium]|nr:Stk1 family PASTA domain-containing Ser/Thr kinase [Clostridiales bacterium]
MYLESGSLISGRYRIKEELGVGGTAVVYKALDEKLNRVVTFKALKEEFIDNEDFVKRFTTEAQAVAGLTHPNIVSAYDVGRDGNICYIIMEYIDGPTLKELIIQNAPFTNEETLGVSMQIASALEAAHRNHIVHRDIKPQNILVTKEGNIKVTDFGIAKAATNATLTADQMGSAHYFSPEQARGGFVDNKSDIYSLGIVMYEMLTGQPPFDGESPVALALKHMDEPLPDIRAINSNVSDSLIKIIQKATAKKASQRYASASDLTRDLKKAIVDTTGSFVTDNIIDKTSQTLILTPEERKAIREGSSSSRTTRRTTGSSQRKPHKKTRSEVEREKELERRRREKEAEEAAAANRKVIMGAVITGVAIIAVITIVIAILVGGNSAGDVVMPDLVNMTQELAEKSAKENGIFLEIEQVESDELVGMVVGQSVDAGKKVSKGDTVTIQVSIGNGEVEFPDIVGDTMEEAQTKLKALGITNIKFTRRQSSNIASGTVISTDPEAGKMVAVTDEVTLYISIAESENMVEVEDVLGLTESEAVEILEEQGFVVKVEESASDEYPEGQVCAQSKDGGFEAVEGSTIMIYISTGAAEISTVTEATTEEPKTEAATVHAVEYEEVVTPSYSSVTVPVTKVPDSDSTNVRIAEVGLDGSETTVYDQTLSKSSFPYSVNVSGTGSTYIVYYDGVISAVHSYDDGGLSRSNYYEDGKIVDSTDY